MRGPLLNIPNVISLARIPLAVAACIFVVNRMLWPVLATIFIGVFSDFLDGIVARKFGMISDWGKVFDPLSDKIAIGAFIITMVFLRAVPVWFVIVFILRDLLIAAGGIYMTKKLGSPPASNIWGKLTTLSTSIYLTVAAVGYMLDRELFPLGLSFKGLNLPGIVSLAFVLISFFVYFSESVSKLRSIR